MNEKEILQQAAIYSQKRYNGLNELSNITKQLQDALEYNDVVTIRMLIRMRQEEMDNIDQIDQQREECITELTEVQKKALKEGDLLPFSEENAIFVQKIAEIREKNKRLLEKLIEQDKRVNLKLAGENSYYKK